MICSVPLLAGQRSERTRENPTSIGEIALMARRAADPQILEALRRTLREGGPRERAACARVARVTRIRALAPDLTLSLQTETDALAAIEEIEALLTGVAGKEETLALEAGKRLGDQVLAEVGLNLARLHGAQAIPEYLPHVEAALKAESRLTDFFEIAALRDPTALAAPAKAALESGTTHQWLAILTASIRSEVLLESSLLVAALRHSSPVISSETAWHLAEHFARKPWIDRKDLLPAVEDALAQRRSSGEDVDAAMGYELLARVLARAPQENAAWIAYLKSPGKTRIGSSDVLTALVRFLTPGERKAVRKRFHRLFPYIKFEDTVEPKQAPKEEPLQVVRLASEYPPGFVSGVLEATGCSLDYSLLIGDAEVTYDSLGVPVKIRLMEAPPLSHCLEAIKTLFATDIGQMGDSGSPGTPQRVFVIVEKGYLSRLDRGPDRQTIWITSSDSDVTNVTPPVRTHFVPPSYPEKARSERKTGKAIVEVVVDESGLVSDIQLLKATDDVFILPAFASIARWRYKPAMLAAHPVRVYLTVIVEFALR